MWCSQPCAKGIELIHVSADLLAADKIDKEVGCSLLAAIGSACRGALFHASADDEAILPALGDKRRDTGQHLDHSGRFGVRHAELPCCLLPTAS
jgi:hypothetical protein